MRIESSVSVLFRQDSARIEQDAVVFGAGDERWIGRAQFRHELVRGFDIQRQDPGFHGLTRQAAAAYCGFGLDHFALPKRFSPRFSPRLDLLPFHRDHLPDGDFALGLVFEIVQQRGSDPSQCDLIRADGARQWMFLDLGNQVFAANDDSRLRAAQQFVA